MSVDHTKAAKSCASMNSKCTISLFEATTALCKATLILGALFSASTHTASASPQGGNIITGASSIDTSLGGHNTTINQTAQKAIIEWDSFDTSTLDSVKFNQANSSYIALNRVIGGSPTNFRGRLEAPGQVWIINRKGITTGSTAQFDVGGLMLSTADITNSNFLNPTPTIHGGSQYHFETDDMLASVKIHGSNIQAADGGYITLFAPAVTVESNAVLTARGGAIAAGAGGQKFDVSIDPVGDGLINFEISDPVTQRNLANAMDIQKSVLDVSHGICDIGGRILLKAQDLNGVYDTLINISNVAVLDASGPERGGDIIIDAAGYSDKLVNIGRNESGSTHGGVIMNASGQQGGLIQIEAYGYDNGNNQGTPYLSINDVNIIDATGSDKAHDGAIIINALRNDAYSDADIDIDGFQRYDQLNPQQSNIIRPCPTINGDGCGNPGPGPNPNPDPGPGPNPNPDPGPGPNPNPDPGPGPNPNPDPGPGPNPNPDPGPGPNPAPTPGPTISSTNINKVALNGFEENLPLNRYFMSQRDEGYALERGLIYERGFQVNRSVALENLKLASAGGAAPINVGTSPAGAAPTAASLGALTPSAGGDLANLSPSAGGLPTSTTNVVCANAYLDSDWNVPQEQRNCSVQPTQQTR